jgi:hypothetical protein
MTISDVEAHSRAVSSIQALLSKHSPGSSPYRIAERALDLAFNSTSARGVTSEEELLSEAEDVIERQVRAKLLVEPAASLPPFASSERETVRRRYLAWRGPLRPRVAEKFVQAELWLTTEECSGGGHVQVC